MSPVIPPSLIEAARSGDVRGANLAVYIELHEWLDWNAFRPIKPWCIASRLHMSERTVYQAIGALILSGYLDAGDRYGNARTFRLKAA